MPTNNQNAQQKLESFILDSHRAYQQEAVLSSRNCTSVNQARASAEYKLCIDTISHKYNKLLAAIDFKTQLAHELLVSKRQLADLQAAHQQKRNHLFNQQLNSHKIFPTLTPAVATSIFTLLVGGLSYPLIGSLGMGFFVLLALVWLVGLAITSRFIKTNNTAPLHEIETLHTLRGAEAAERKWLQEQYTEAVSKAVAVERLVVKLYQEAIRRFQMELVFSRNNITIPDNMSDTPPSLNYIYLPIIQSDEKTTTFSDFAYV